MPSGLDMDQVEHLRELRENDHSDRLRRLERRDLVQEEAMADIQSTMRSMRRGLWVGCGLLIARVMQEGGGEWALRMVSSLIGL